MITAQVVTEVLDYLWAPLTGAFVFLFKRITELQKKMTETQLQVGEQARRNSEVFATKSDVNEALGVVRDDIKDLRGLIIDTLKKG